jgi:hypothetical protein
MMYSEFLVVVVFVTLRVSGGVFNFDFTLNIRLFN